MMRDPNEIYVRRLGEDWALADSRARADWQNTANQRGQTFIVLNTNEVIAPEPKTPTPVSPEQELREAIAWFRDLCAFLQPQKAEHGRWLARIAETNLELHAAYKALPFDARAYEVALEARDRAVRGEDRGEAK